MQYTFGPLMVLYLLTALKGTFSNPSTREAVAGSTGRLEKQPILLHDRQRSAVSCLVWWILPSARHKTPTTYSLPTRRYERPPREPTGLCFLFKRAWPRRAAAGARAARGGPSSRVPLAGRLGTAAMCAGAVAVCVKPSLDLRRAGAQAATRAFAPTLLRCSAAANRLHVGRLC